MHPNLPKSRLFMLIFLSTEAMFFTALIAVYVVLRLAAGTNWPTHAAVGLHLWLGMVNTGVLLTSGVTMARAARAVAANQPALARNMLGLTIVLGTLFLAIKGYEYADKIRHGLYPRRPAQLVAATADLDYLASVGREIQRTRQQLDQQPATAEAESTRSKLDILRSGLFHWTAIQVARVENPYLQASLLGSVAPLIHPGSSTDSGVISFLQAERRSIMEERRELARQKADLEMRLDAATPQTPASGAGGQSVGEAATPIGDWRFQLTAVNNRIGEVDDRLRFFELLDTIMPQWSGSPGRLEPGGINGALGIHLPIVMPGGNNWINGYWLLTGFHALHLLAGLVVLVGLFFLPLTPGRIPLVQNTGMYWQFVDAVWLVLFVLIYVL